MTGQDGFGARAARDAPGMIARVVEEAKQEAASIVRDRLVEAYVREMEELLMPAPPVAGPLTPSRPAGRRGWYVYGLTWATEAQKEYGEGIGGAPVETVVAGPVAALGSWTDLDSGGWGFGANEEVDLDVIGPRAREHEAVLERVLETASVVPFRFGTVYPGPGDAQRILERHGEHVVATLEHVADRVEWGLTVERSEPGPESTTRSGPGEPSYLAARRDQLDRAAAELEQAHSAATAIHALLCDVAAAGVVHRRRRLVSPRPSVALDASYLVERADEDRFREAAAAALAGAPAELGLTGELSGPWPPYNFVHLELEEPA